MKIAITGSRKVHPDDYKIISQHMKTLCMDSQVECIYFGGAIGVDSLALQSSLECEPRPRLILVVPDKLSNQPRSTWEPSKQADEIIELCNPITYDDFFYSYKLRNIYMVDHSDKTVAFWTGDTKSGTYHTITYTRSKNKPCDIVPLKVGGA